MLEKEEKLEKEERKEFVEPELIKCEEPLDQVTTGNGGSLYMNQIDPPSLQ